MSSIDHHEQAAITLPALIYYLFSTGLNASTRCLPWHVYGQLSLDAFLFVLWLAATAASNYDCSGLCSACATPGEEYYGGYYNVFVGSLTCPCAFGQYDPSLSKVKRALEGRATSSANLNTGKEFESASKIATKLGFHALMIVLFASTTATTIWRVHQAGKAVTISEGHGPASELTNQTDALGERNHPQKYTGIANTPPVSEVQ